MLVRGVTSAIVLLGAAFAVAAPAGAQETGCDWHRSLTQAGSPPGAAEVGDALGAAVVLGDFDGDGRVDVATGVPGENDGAGAVSIFPSPCSGGAPKFISQAGVVPGKSEADDRFGAALAVGDFDGDGFDDLAIGVPGEDIGSATDAGAVAVVFGSSSGLDVTSAQGFSQRAFDRDLLVANARLGGALAAGDLDGDGVDDLLIGQPGRLVDGRSAGAVTLVVGGPLGLATESASHFTQGSDLGGVPESGDDFGAAVAVGDFDGDGLDDLAIGVPGETISGTVDTGTVHVVVGSRRQTVHQDIARVPGRNEAGDGFGTVLAAGDINGDGRDDLAVGAPSEDIGAAVDAGAVTVFSGVWGGVDPAGRAWSQSTSGVNGGAEAGDRFGAAVAVVDVDTDGRAELLIGVPGEESSGAQQAGAMHIVPGRAFPGIGPRDVLLTQASRRVPGAREAGDGFGSAIAAAAGVVFAGTPGEALGQTSNAGVVIPFDSNEVSTLARIVDLAEAVEARGQSITLVAESDEGVIVDYDPDASLIPASNEKLVVAVGAFELLPEEFRYFTEVIVDADRNLYVRASGDPTLTRSGLRRLATQVVDDLAAPVEDVVVVVGRYDDMRLAPGVDPSNMPAYTGPMSEFQVADNRWRTDPGFLTNPDLENVQLFAQYLQQAWSATGAGSAYVSGTPRVGSLPGAATHVTSVSSESRDDLIVEMLRESDNQIADGLVREIAAHHTGFGSLDGGLELIAARLVGMGATAPAALRDGSGLSYTNLMSAESAVSIVRAAQQAPWWDDFRDGLPVAGRTGTLTHRLRGSATVDNVAAKTGSLFVSRSLAGIYTDAGGEPARFAILVNGSSITDARAQIDAIVTLLAELD